MARWRCCAKSDVLSGFDTASIRRFVVSDMPYLSAGGLVHSNLVAIFGRNLAIEFRRAYPIEIRELPFEAPVLQSVMSWHRRFDDVPAHRWLRSTIIGTAVAL
jgi:hypothetical protein